jgi:hypothetical protein
MMACYHFGKLNELPIDNNGPYKIMHKNCTTTTTTTTTMQE